MQGQSRNRYYLFLSFAFFLVCLVFDCWGPCLRLTQEKFIGLVNRFSPPSPETAGRSSRKKFNGFDCGPRKPLGQIAVGSWHEDVRREFATSACVPGWLPFRFDLSLYARWAGHVNFRLAN